MSEQYVMNFPVAQLSGILQKAKTILYVILEKKSRRECKGNEVVDPK